MYIYDYYKLVLVTIPCIYACLYLVHLCILRVCTMLGNIIAASLF